LLALRFFKVDLVRFIWRYRFCFVGGQNLIVTNQRRHCCLYAAPATPIESPAEHLVHRIAACLRVNHYFIPDTKSIFYPPFGGLPVNNGVLVFRRRGSDRIKAGYLMLLTTKSNSSLFRR